MNTIHIVGCGTVGSNLAINIAQYNLADELHLYDYDIVSNRNPDGMFPLYSKYSGLLKVNIVGCAISEMSDIKVVTHELRVTEPITDGYVIDCRDRKDNIINSDVKLSLDNHVLIIDNTFEDTNFDFSNYCSIKEPKYIVTAMGIILSFITSDNQYKNRKIMYDLDEVIRDFTTITK
jgi:hypothetical protein